MKTLMRAFFVMAMALTLFYSAGAGVSHADSKNAGNPALSGTFYDDFVGGVPADDGTRTPDAISW
jgi:hypothetical protein